MRKQLRLRGDLLRNRGAVVSHYTQYRPLFDNNGRNY